MIKNSIRASYFIAIILPLWQCARVQHTPEEVYLPEWGYSLQLWEEEDSCRLIVRDIDAVADSTVSVLSWQKTRYGSSVFLFFIEKDKWIIDSGAANSNKSIVFNSNSVCLEWREKTLDLADKRQLGKDYFYSNKPLSNGDIPYVSMLWIHDERLLYKSSPEALPYVLYDGSRYDRIRRAHFKSPRNVDKIVDEKSGLSIELRVDYDYAYIFTYDISTGELRDSLKVWTWMKSLGSIYKGIPMAMPTIVDQSLWIRFDKDTTYVARGGKVAAEQYGNKVLKCLNDLDAVDFIRSSTSSETGREQSCLVEIIDNRIQIIRNE